MGNGILRCLLAAGTILVAAALLPVDGRAEGITVAGDLLYENSKSNIESKQTGEEVDVDFSRFYQQYFIELAKEIFPFVDLRTGLLLERTKTKTTTDAGVDDFRSKLTDRTRAYFFELRLDNPMYGAGLTYRDTEDKISGTNLPDLKIFREEYTGHLTYRPDLLPSANLTYRRNRTYNRPRTQEVVLDFLNVDTQYEYENLRLDYTYTRNDVEERIDGIGEKQLVHDGEMSYTTGLLGDRVSVKAGSQLTYRVSDPSGTSVVRLPTSFPDGSFYLLDDSTPESNAAGEFTTVDLANPLTDVNIGPDGPQNLVSFGVEFSSPTQVDAVYVLPLEDATNPSLASPGEIDAVADEFIWQVFSSDDQETWTELNVIGVSYEVFENRFEISFSSPADVRFLKVATTPLSGGATRDILISQLQTFETVGSSPGTTVRSFRQIYNLGLRSELSTDTRTFYDLYYKVEDLDPSAGRRTWLTNSVGLKHAFGPRLQGSTRFMRTVITRPNEDDGIQNSYVAALRADHLDTFYQTLTYSYLYNRDDDGSDKTSSVWLRNNVKLHPNWSSSLDFGYVRRSPLVRPTSSKGAIRLMSSLNPNRWMSFRLDHWLSWEREKHQGTRRQHRWNFSGFLVPTDALSVFADLSYNDDGFGDHRFSQDYSVHWGPFPDGDLDLSLTYRRFENRSDRKGESITPEARWEIRPGLLGILSYRISSEETETLERDVNVFTAELQFAFR
jgi:hypothetical protein